MCMRSFNSIESEAGDNTVGVPVSSSTNMEDSTHMEDGMR